MPAQIRYKSFRKLDPAGQPSHDYNLTDPVKVHADMAETLKVALADFNALPDGVEIGFELNNSQIKLRHPAGSGKLQVAPAEVGNVYDYLTKQLEVDNLSSLQKLLVISKDYPYLPELLERLQTVSIPDPKVAEIQSRIDVMEGKISKQRDVDNASMEIGDLEIAVESIKAQLQIVQELVQKRNQLGLKLQQLQSVNPESNKEAQAEWLKQITDLRHEELLKLQTIKSEVAQLEVDDHQPKYAKLLIGLGVVLFLGGLGASFLVSTIWPAILGLLGLSLEAAGFFVINKIPAKFDLNSHISIVQKQVESANSGNSESETKINNLEKQFVHNAWVGVLQHEIEMIGENIKNQLDGEDYQTVQTEKEKLQDRIKHMKAEVDSYQGQDINPEDYLRLRRELDLLKIEKAKLEGFPDKEQSSHNAFQELLQQLKLVQPGEEVKAADVVIPENMRQIAAISAALEYWRSIQGVWPLSLIDIMQDLPADWQKTLGDKIVQYQNSGQILIIES